MLHRAVGAFCLAAAITVGLCGNGDDLRITRCSPGSLTWSNGIVGTTCDLQMTPGLLAGPWTNLLSGIEITSTVMKVDLPALEAGAAFFRVARPFDAKLGLVAWYQFEGDARDYSGWHHDGTNNGVEFVAGPTGLCGHFDGSNAHIRVPQTPALRLTNALTLCAWVKPLAVDGLRCVVDKDYSFVGYNLYLNNGGAHMRINNSAVTSGPVTNGGWQHIAGVYTASRIRIFVNGVRRGEASAGALSDRVDKDVFIGMWGPPGGPDRYFSGWIDDLRIYARALTPTEILRLAQGAE